MRGNARGLLVPGRNCWRMAHAATGRIPGRRKRVFQCGPRRACRRAAGHIHSRLGHRQPHVAGSRWRERRLSRAAARVSRCTSGATTATAHPRAELGLRVAVCARARVAWTAEVRLADAKQTAFRARQPSSDRRVAPSEAGRRRRCAGVRQRLRPHLQPLGHAAPFAGGAGAAQSGRHPLSAFSRCRSVGRRRGSARIGRACPRALASCDRTHGAAARSEDGARLVAGRCGHCHQRCRTRDRAHRARVRRRAGDHRSEATASGCDRRRHQVDFRRKPIFHFSPDRRCVRVPVARCRRTRSRGRLAYDAKRLARGLDDGRSPGTRAPPARAGRYPSSLQHVLPVAG